MRKYYISIILLIVICLLVSCVEGTNENGHEYINLPIENELHGEIEIEDNYEKVFEATSVSFFFSNQDERYGYNYVQDRIDWYEFVEKSFDIDLQISSAYEDRERLYGFSSIPENYEFLKSSINEGKIKGLFKVIESNVIKKLAEDNLIYPLNSLLENNINWKRLPKEWREAYMIDGYIWAIPTYQTDVSFSRYIRKDWLDNLSLEAPFTINEFYEILNAFTYNDPDKDGANNTSGAIFWGKEGLEDIFSSFNVRLNHNGDALPTWNPITDKWEDSMLKSEMKDCLDYILSCQKEGIITKMTVIGNDNDFSRGYSGSYNSLYSNYGNVSDTILQYRPETITPQVDIINGLTHTISDKISGYYKNYGVPYILTSSTKNPSSTLNFYLDSLLTDKNGYFIGKYGLQNKSYFIESDILFYKTTTYNGKNYVYQMPDLVGASPFFTYSRLPDFASESDISKVAKETRYDELKRSSLSYEIPWDVVMPTYDNDIIEVLDNFKNIGNSILNSIINGETSYKDGLEQYRHEAKQVGMQDFLDMQNDKIGKTSSQYY